MSRLIDSRRKRADDALAQQRWFYYAKAGGMFLPDYEDDAFFSDEQAKFFLEYELQMEERDEDAADQD